MNRFLVSSNKDVISIVTPGTSVFSSPFLSEPLVVLQSQDPPDALRLSSLLSNRVGCVTGRMCEQQV